MNPMSSTWSKTNGSSMPCIDRRLPFLTGDRQVMLAVTLLVGAIYANLDPRLTRAAGMSVLAHLEDLVLRGLVATDGDPSIAGRYRMAK